MEKFDKASECKKCGEMAPGSKFTYADHPSIIYQSIEVIQRTCRHCGFEWNELPIDTINTKG
jgi:RNase P subunit RPR2